MRKEKILGLIPARGGSKGIPNKNVRELGGKPLIAWTIDAARKAQCIDRVVVSTDDHGIALIAEEWGADVPFIRPSELAEDNVHRNPVVIHALQKLPGYDYVILLQPTVPLRSASSIDGAMQKLIESTAESCVSVVEQHPSPCWMFKKNIHGYMEPIMGSWELPQRRQDTPVTYVLNGAIYIAKTHYFLHSEFSDPFVTPETLPFEMTREESIDIDDEYDLSLAEHFINISRL